MTELKPWAKGPFELILHAEIHLRKGDDYDRRLALISFDNSVEVAITTYLSLNPIQRGGKEYSREDVRKWLVNYHTKIDFFMKELEECSLPEKIEKSVIIWYHDHRNEQYHSGTRGVPGTDDLEGIRETALWVFSVLYDVPDIETVLDEAIKDKEANPFPERDDKLDRLIDSEYGTVDLAGQPYYVSEILHAVDPFSYQNIATELGGKTKLYPDSTSEEMINKLRAKYGPWLRPKLESAKFGHYNGRVYLVTEGENNEGIPSTFSMETDHYGGPYDGLLFPPSVDAQINADRFIRELGPYDITMTTDLFTEEACKLISEAHENGKLADLKPTFSSKEDKE